MVKKMSNDVDTHDLLKDGTFRTAFLSEMVDFVCEKKPRTLIIRDLEYAKIVRCKDCKWQMTVYCPMLTWERKGDHYCYKGEMREDE